MDAARALQHLRSKAGEWNLDKTRIAASGVSAGGCSSLWLAMHDDMADARSADAIARESTRVLFTATKAPQPPLNPKHLDDLREWSPMSHASADDPPAVILTTKEDKPPLKGEAQKDTTHSAVIGLMLQDTLSPFGVKCEVRHPFEDKPETTMQEVLLAWRSDALTSPSPAHPARGWTRNCLCCYRCR